MGIMTITYDKAILQKGIQQFSVTDDTWSSCSNMHLFLLGLHAT